MSGSVEAVDAGEAVTVRQRHAFGGNRRTFALAALGAVCGLLVAAYGLFTATGTTTLLVPATDVALVNRQSISRIDYLATLENLFGADAANATPEQRRAALDSMVEEELFVQRARELDVAGVDPDVRAAMVRAVGEQAAASAVLEHPDEEKLQAFFAAHRSTYASEGTMTLRDIVFDDLAAAQAAAARARDGGGVAALIAGGGRDTGSVTGEEFYFAAKAHLGERSFGVAVTLASGKISEPIEADGIHVLAMIRNQPPVPLSFAVAHMRVLADYRRDAIARRQTREAEFLRQRATIQVAPDLQ